MIQNGRGEEFRALVSQLYKSRSPPKTTRRDVLIKQIKSAETVPLKTTPPTANYDRGHSAHPKRKGGRAVNSLDRQMHEKRKKSERNEQQHK